MKQHFQWLVRREVRALYIDTYSLALTFSFHLFVFSTWRTFFPLLDLIGNEKKNTTICNRLHVITNLITLMMTTMITSAAEGDYIITNEFSD